MSARQTYPEQIPCDVEAAAFPRGAAHSGQRRSAGQLPASRGLTTFPLMMFS